jgi:hypothetical protein
MNHFTYHVGEVVIGLFELGVVFAICFAIYWLCAPEPRAARQHDRWLKANPNYDPDNEYWYLLPGETVLQYREAFKAWRAEHPDPPYRKPAWYRRRQDTPTFR